MPKSDVKHLFTTTTTIFLNTNAVLTTTTHAVLTTTTHAVLTITTLAVFFHTLISYKKLCYIQPPLLHDAVSSRQLGFYVATNPGDDVGSLLRSFTVAVVSALHGRGETGDDCIVLVLQCRVHGAESHAVVVFFPHL